MSGLNCKLRRLWVQDCSSQVPSSPAHNCLLLKVKITHQSDLEIVKLWNKSTSGHPKTVFPLDVSFSIVFSLWGELKVTSKRLNAASINRPANGTHRLTKTPVRPRSKRKEASGCQNLQVSIPKGFETWIFRKCWETCREIALKRPRKAFRSLK